MAHYDLVIIGGGPAGEKAAAKAAYFGKKVALIEGANYPGGAGVHTGTLPSKTLKETVLYLTGKGEKGLYGVDKTLDHDISIENFFHRKNEVTRTEVDSINRNLVAHKVDVFYGVGRFVDPHTVQVNGKDEATLTGDFILISTGSYPFHPSNIPFDGKRVHDSDSILGLSRFPKSIVVVGAGVIGCEYSTIFSTIGAKVDLIEGRETILPFLDDEITADLIRQMRAGGVEMSFQTTIEKVEAPANDADPIRVTVKAGGAERVIETDMLLYAAGRSGSTSKLACEKAGVKIGKRETIEVDENYRSSVPHIYAAGDVIGFPALASTSMDQGRIAVTHMFHTEGVTRLARIFPYGIYTIPEVSMVGMTEEEAVAKGLSYGVGRARHAHMARGKIMGAREGFLKLVFDRETQTVLGVHIIGSLAAELIHYGMALVENKKTLDDLIMTVFNYPTLHDLFKYAAYDGLGNLAGRKLKEG